MRTFTVCWLLLSVVLTSNAQTRANLESALAPFYHGVASGDPLTDRVILWTRITLNAPVDPVSVQWEIATDTLFNNVINSGSVSTDVSKDYTVKVDATGLQPDAWYYYRFFYNGSFSIIGRTHTLPNGATDSIRLGVVSCSDYENGYFNSYNHLGKRNDLDYILHLGDYIYEYGAGSVPVDFQYQPANEIITVSDYRIRHSLYKLDKDLQLLHQQVPFICVWDDHESANNAYKDGAQNHTPGSEGTWVDRKRASVQAYLEWMPIRQPDPTDTVRIYRDFKFGDLAQLYMLDTRLEGREVQLATSDPGFNDPARKMISQNQLDWLRNGITTSNSQWQILGQQVMVAPLTVFGFPVNTDQWDGYPKQRDTLYSLLMHPNVQNAVVLTGDIHTSWANDLPLSNYNSGTGDNSAGVEFVTTSITSSNFPFPVSSSIIRNVNPHIKFADLTNHGYTILDINQQRVQADFININELETKNYVVELDATWQSTHQSRRLSQASGASVGGLYPPMAPLPNYTTSVHDAQQSMVVSAFPNPFMEQIVVQYFMSTTNSVQFTLTNLQGQVIKQQNLGTIESGLQHLHFDGSQLVPGTYFITLQVGSSVKTTRILKID